MAPHAASVSAALSSPPPSSVSMYGLSVASAAGAAADLRSVPLPPIHRGRRHAAAVVSSRGRCQRVVGENASACFVATRASAITTALRPMLGGEERWIRQDALAASSQGI